MEWLTGGRTGEAKRLISQLTDATKRDHAARELGKMGAEAAPALIDSLATRDPGLREIVSSLLVRLGPRFMPALIQALAAAHPEVRGQIASILGGIGDPQAVPALTDALRGEFYTVRASAALALGQLRAAQAIPTLSAALRDTEPEVRAAACLALGRFADPNTFDAIGDVLLGDPQMEVRRAAAEAFGETQRPEAIRYLMDALRDSIWWYERDQSVNILLDAILKMGRAVVPEAIEALGDPEGTVRRLAAQLLGRLADERGVEPLTISLYDTHFDVCRASAEALAAIGAPALPVLLEALHHPEAWIRQQSVIGLERSRDPQVVPALLNLLGDENPDVRKQVVASLGQSRDPRALPALQELADSRADREMAALAKQAIQTLQSP
jgi:HEAT repeat protein